jgi:hypothetical protein
VLIIVVVIVAVALIGVVSVITLEFFLVNFVTNAPIDHVTEIDYTAPDRACGLTSAAIQGDWFGHSGEGISVSYVVANNNLSAFCQVVGVGTTTSGFTISSSNVPLNIPPGGQQTLLYTFVFPSGPYLGAITVVIS